MNFGGFIPIAGGILFLFAAFGNIEWLMKNRGSFLIKILGREGVRGWLAIVGLFLIGVGVFLLVVG